MTKKKKSTVESVEGASTQPVAAVGSKRLFKLNDDLIGMIRELVQLALLTGTNIVDHLRAVVVQESDADGRFVTVAPEYVEAYNQMILKLSEEAEQKMKEMQETEATDTSPSSVRN